MILMITGVCLAKDKCVIFFKIEQYNVDANEQIRKRVRLWEYNTDATPINNFEEGTNKSSRR
jgi:hypothetical protein